MNLDRTQRIIDDVLPPSNNRTFVMEMVTLHGNLCVLCGRDEQQCTSGENPILLYIHEVEYFDHVLTGSCCGTCHKTMLDAIRGDENAKTIMSIYLL